MNLLFTIIVTFFAGMGAGLGTGFAGMSAAAVISPMLITFLDYDGQRAAVHRGGQLGGKPDAFHHHGQLFGVYDIPAGY